MCSTIQSRHESRHLLRQVVAIALLSPLFVATSHAATTIRVPQDHQTIQAGIDAAEHGDTVLVSAGTYKERIRMKAGVIVRSAGDDAKGKIGLKRAEATIIDGNVEGATSPGVVMAEDSTFDGFSVTGVGSYDEVRWEKHHATQGEEQAKEMIGAPGTAGIAVEGVSRCTVSNNIVHHIGYTGIGITGVKGKHVSPHIVRNVTYRNMGGGVGSMRGSSAIIEENICFENFYAGIGNEDANPLIINNTCYRNVRAGIGISEGSCPTVRSNKCYHNRRAGIGVRTEATTSPVIEYNECYENDMAGIGVREDATPVVRYNRCHNNAMAGIGCRTKACPLIEHNECFENGMTGIGCRTEAEPVIRHNRCYNNKQAGIGSQLGARPVILGNECFDNLMAGIGTESKAVAVIRDNKCYRNKQAGIGSRSGSRPLIAGNECYENERAGIGHRDGANTMLIDNYCHHNKAAGIVFSECKSGSSTVLNNRVIDNALVAVGIHSGWTVNLSGNELSRNGGLPPLVIVFDDAEAIFMKNTIRGQSVAGIRVAGKVAALQNRFEGTSLRNSGPPNYAIWALEGSQVTMSDNHISTWRHALYGTGSAITANDNTVSNFFRTAFVVNKPTQPAHVYGNTAVSANPKDKVVSIDGQAGIVADNQLRQKP